MDKIESHADEALARLVEVLKTKPKIRALLTALCGPAQRIEDVLYQLLTERYLDTASGAQLDTLGVIVGQARGGLSDEDYKRFLRARVKTNRSSGLRDQLLAIARLVVDDDSATITARHSFPAGVVYELGGIAFDADSAEVLVSFLRDASADGVRLILDWSPVIPAETFVWDSTEWDDGLTWGESLE